MEHLKKNEYCDEHFHESMIEIFFFLKDNGAYWNNAAWDLFKDRPFKKDYFKCEENTLEFFYIGIPVKHNYYEKQNY